MGPECNEDDWAKIMCAAKLGKSAACGKSEAKVRLGNANQFMSVAELVNSSVEDGTDLELSSVAAALAVLAGIAASDAVCCLKLLKRSRGTDHQQATEFLSRVDGGDKAAVHLSELLSLKDTAHYGVIPTTSAQLKVAMRRASALVQFANEVFAAN